MPTTVITSSPWLLPPSLWLVLWLRCNKSDLFPQFKASDQGANSDYGGNLPVNHELEEKRDALKLWMACWNTKQDRGANTTLADVCAFETAAQYVGKKKSLTEDRRLLNFREGRR